MSATDRTPVEKIKVAILEDDAAYSRDLAFLLNRSDRVACLAVYATAEDALKELPSQSPDVVLIDIELAGRMSGIQAARLLKQQLPNLRCVMLTRLNSGEVIFESLLAGIDGYVDKQENVLVGMVADIEKIHREGAFLSPKIASRILQHFKANPEFYTLTPREQQIVQRLCQGYSQKEIAAQLGLSPVTIKTHCQNINEKLGVKNRIAALEKIFPHKPGSIDPVR